MIDFNPTDPIPMFKDWLEKARISEINDPNAMALATSTKNGHPSVRMVLLKQIDEVGFKFHTNCQSQKGEEIEKNPHAALCFYWKSLRKQVRVEGKIKYSSPKSTDEYFANRPYARQIGAHASRQSRPLESRESLEKKIKDLQIKYPKDSIVPRPVDWLGYILVPNKIEFWWDNPDRLHDRILYTKTKQNDWETTRLYP